MSALFNWLPRLERTQSYLLAALTSVIVGFAASEAYRWSMEADYRERFDDQAWFAASNLEAETLNGLAMGTVQLLGLNEPHLKDVVLGKLSRDDSGSLRRLRAVRQLLNADGVFVFNSQGDVVAHETPRERMTGLNVSERRYWQPLIHGSPVVYPAVSERMNERKLFIAAPIHSGTATTSEVIGAVGVETIADYLDYLIGVGGYSALLLSPQGVVFAATDKSWLFRLAHPYSPEDFAELKKMRQFGSALPESQDAASLPFDLHRKVVEFSGIRYAKAVAPVRWKDPTGDWTLVILGDLGNAVSLKERGFVGLLVASLVFSLALLFRRALRYEAARREAVNKAETAAEALAAEARQKSRLSEITIRLQQARGPAALADVFFSRLAELVPLHQGSLYFIDSVGNDRSALRLAGSYGTHSAPERVGVGEGLLGQCAHDCQVLVFTEVPTGFWKISSGLGEAAPGVLMLFPLLNNKVLLGVLEVASLDSRFLASQEMFESLQPVLSMNLEILLAERLSEHNSAESALKAEQYKSIRERETETENWYRSVIDGMPDGVMVIDPRGGILLSNPAAATIFGYDETEMKTLGIRGLMPDLENAAFSSQTVTASGKSGGEMFKDSACWQRRLTGIHKERGEIAIEISLANLPATVLQGDCACVTVRPCAAAATGGLPDNPGRRGSDSMKDDQLRRDSR